MHDGYSCIIDRQTDKKILWKCEYSRKFKCCGRLHTDLNNILIKAVALVNYLVSKIVGTEMLVDLENLGTR